MIRQTAMARYLMQMALAAVLVANVANAAETFVGRVTAVPDGDTLWVQPQDASAARKLRLLGIDAPEICQPGGQAARAALQALVASGTVSVEVRYRDDYGRGLARVRVGQQDIAATLVRAGHAWSNRWKHSLGPYATEENAARLARAGLFATTNPELPRDFRKRHGSCYLP